MSERFCRDCKYSRGEGTKMTCEAPQNSVPHVSQEKYLVTGEVQPTVMATRGASCLALRMKRPQQVEDLTCAPVGRWFVAKEIAP